MRSLVKVLSPLLVAVFGIAALNWFHQGWEPGHNRYRSTASLADLDGDGDLDVIVGRTRWESPATSYAGIALWINQGEGHFTRINQALPGGFSAAAGDVDGDGDADLLVLNGYGLTLSLNQGGDQGGKNGVFKAANSAYPPMAWRGHADMGGSVVLGDLSNDGKVDGFVAGCCFGSSREQPSDSSLIPSSSWVWINTWGSEGWLVRDTQPITELDGLPIPALALGDLDGDGDLDVLTAVGTPSLGEASILGNRLLVNDGSGNFTDSGRRLGETEGTAAALGDMDGDGDLDILVGTRTGAVVWINRGHAQGGMIGDYAAGQEIAGDASAAVFLADLNGDGKLDALIADSEHAAIWWNDGHGALSRSDQRFGFSARHGLAVGDFDGDGCLDLFAGTLEKDYAVWVNQGRGTFHISSVK
jgi:hypothetical protein